MESWYNNWLTGKMGVYIYIACERWIHLIRWSRFLYYAVEVVFGEAKRARFRGSGEGEYGGFFILILLLVSG